MILEITYRTQRNSTFKEVTKEFEVKEVINYGSEVNYILTNGWYVAPQNNSRWDIHNKNGVFMYGCEEPKVVTP